MNRSRTVFAALAGGIGLVLWGATPLSSARAAQTPADPKAGVVDPMRVARHISRLAADSMQAPVAPSPGLERRAQYVAAEFQRLGLTQLAYSGGLVQRYPVPGQKRVDVVKSRATLMTMAPIGAAPIFTEAGRPSFPRALEADFSTTARIVASPEVMVTSFFASGPVVLLTGPHRVADLQADDVRDKIVLYVPPLDEDARARQQMTDTLRALARLVVLADDRDSARGADTVKPAEHEPRSIADSYLADVAGQGNSQWMLALSMPLLVEFVARAGGDLTQGRAAAAPAVQTLPRTAVGVGFQAEGPQNPVTAPNVIGVLEGTDPQLKDHYVVVSARLDDTPGAGTDGVAGTAGLLALAEAFRESNLPRPRSLAFLAWSGGGSAGWGNNFFAQFAETNLAPTQSGLAAHAHLAVALRGRPDADTADKAPGIAAVDTVTIDGLHDVDVPLAQLVAAHPELGVAVRAGATVFEPTSPSFAFARRVVPTLAFRPGTTTGVGSTGVARLLQLMYSVGDVVANADGRVRWSADGLRELSALRDP